MVSGNAVLHGDVVGPVHPADGLRVRHHGGREHRGAPALDGVSEELAAADEDGEEGQQGDGVHVVQAVRPVVVLARVQLGERRKSTKNVADPGGERTNGKRSCVITDL